MLKCCKKFLDFPDVEARSTSITFGSFSRDAHKTIHFAPLLQPFIHTSTCLLHLLWAPLGYLTQLSGRLSVLWLAGNLAISVFLAQPSEKCVPHIS